MENNSFENIFEAFTKQRVLIIGDVMLDAYDWGKVERISPEAPVPIINITNSEYRLGGAANVALNIQALGATPILCALIGNDAEGNELKKILADKDMPTDGIISSNERPTTVKRRILAGSQHLLRIDKETTKEASLAEQDLLLSKIEMLLKNCDVVIFEDYDKGVITPNIIEKVVRWCKMLNIPIAVDPKKRNFLAYEGVTLFKPNLKELKEGLKIDFDVSGIGELESAVQHLHEQIHAQKYLITLSEHGVFIKSESNTHRISAHLREIADVSGAGDSVIATAALCLALKLPDILIAQISNLAGGLVCEHVGVVPIIKRNLLSESQLLLKI